MQTQCDLNLNTVTVFGKMAAHRINTGKRDPQQFKWKKAQSHLGYGQAVDEVNWKGVIEERRTIAFNGGYRTLGASQNTGFGLPGMHKQRR